MAVELDGESIDWSLHSLSSEHASSSLGTPAMRASSSACTASASVSSKSRVSVSIRAILEGERAGVGEYIEASGAPVVTRSFEDDELLSIV